MNKSYAPIAFMADNVNELNIYAVADLCETGIVVESRNGPAKFIPRYELVLTNPQNRYLSIPERKYNIFQIMAETFWVMAGRTDVKGYLEFFLPRALNFSDDGVNWRGAYGGRIYEYGQMQDAVDAFIEDGAFTRRCVIAIYDPSKDSKDSLMAKYSITNTKDLPCNDFIQFWSDGEDIMMDVYQRSGDIFWGTGSINLYEFAFLQECFVALVNTRSEKKYGLGSYRQMTTNLHFYPQNVGTQAEDICSGYQWQSDIPPYDEVMGGIDIGPINDTETLKNFFQDCVMSFTRLQNRMKDNYVLDVFKKYEIPASHKNTLWVVASTIETYIYSKVFVDEPKCSMEEGFFRYHEPLLESIRNCKFTNFEIEDI